MEKFPRCPEHGRMLLNASKDCKRKQYEEFVCQKGHTVVDPAHRTEHPLRECSEVYHAEKPKCPRCRREMALRVARQGENKGNYFWGCRSWPSCNGTIDFSVCVGCGGMRWLHCGTGEVALLDNGTKTNLIGHYGEHIEACDDCRDKNWDDISAFFKHLADCNCGHGLARGPTPVVWTDYRGRNGELLNAMINAGLHVTLLGDEDIEVEIRPENFVVFNATLEKVYGEWLASKEGGMTDAEKKAYEGAHRLCTPGVCRLSAIGKVTPCEFKQGDKVQATDKVWLIPSSDKPSEEVRFQDVKTGRTSSKHAVPANPPRADAPAPKASVSEKSESRDYLLSSSEKLLNVLNGMVFSDHPVKDQRALEEARRDLFRAISKTKRLLGEDLGGYAADLFGREKNGRNLSRSGSYILGSMRKLEGENVLKGLLTINGQEFHAFFVEVHTVNGMQQPVNDPANRFFDIATLNDGPMQTTKVSGFEGDYVMCVFPMGR